MNHTVRLPILMSLLALMLFASPARSEMQQAAAPVLHVGSTAFDRAALEAMSIETVETTTAWTDGPQVFEGPLARDVLAAAGVEGETVRAVALNDYAVDIPRSDFQRYDVIIALRHNGKAMSVRDKGPLWIVYPRDDHPELQSSAQNDKWIWQLHRLDVR
jgi:hypothetical protein